MKTTSTQAMTAKKTANRLVPRILGTLAALGCLCGLALMFADPLAGSAIFASSFIGGVKVACDDPC